MTDDIADLDYDEDDTASMLPALPEPPWEQADGETAKAFGAFQRYRDMGPERSLQKVADEIGKSKSLMERWSRRWRWQARIEAWERHLDEQRILATNESIRAMAERHARNAQLATQALMLPFAALARKMQDEPDLARNLALAAPGELLRLARSAAHGLTQLMQAERLARGEPTEITRSSGSHTVMEVSVSDDEIAQVAAVLREVGFFDDDGDDSGEAAGDAGDSPAPPALDPT